RNGTWRVVVNENLLANWIFARPVLSRGRFVDDCDPHRTGSIAVSEIASANQRQLQGREKAGFCDVPVGREELAAGRRLPWNFDTAKTHAPAVERQIDRQTRALDAGKC